MGGNQNGGPVPLFLDRMDTIIELLSMLVGGAPTNGLADKFPELARMFSEGLTAAAQTARQNELLEYLVAAALPSAPENARQMTVGTTEELLADNESMPLMRVDVTNLDVAQPLLVSKRGVTVLSGIQVVARQTLPFVLPNGAQLFGIVNLGSVNITVSEGYNMRPKLHQLLSGQ